MFLNGTGPLDVNSHMPTVYRTSQGPVYTFGRWIYFTSAKLAFCEAAEKKSAAVAADVFNIASALQEKSAALNMH